MTFFNAVETALLESDPRQKCAQVNALRAAALAAEARSVIQGIPVPGKPARPLLISPRELPKRGLGSEAGRATLIHAIAHIEFNAINLALDALWRFRGMPDEYYANWLSVAVDEARHFGWLVRRLEGMGYAYGDFPAHNGLWEAACETAGDPLLRMALVPRVLEARGLDVTPGMIKRLELQGDIETVEILGRILAEEVGHVMIGTRWFHFLCAERELEPDSTFKKIVEEHMNPLPKGPLNFAARKESGFSEVELAYLKAAS